MHHKRQVGSQLIERHVAVETAIPRRPGAGRLHYAWIIAAVTFVVVLLTAGVRSAPGLLIVPLEEEFHWSRATISFAVGVNLLLYGAIGPFAAAIMDRFGVRRTMALSLAATGAGVGDASPEKPGSSRSTSTIVNIVANGTSNGSRLPSSCSIM